MKRIFVTGALLIGLNGAYGQTSATHTRGEAGSDKERSAAQANIAGEFANTSMDLHKGKLSFAGLPQLDKPITVSIVNKDGEETLRSKVNALNNSLDVRALERGTYFVKLLYTNESRKGFVLNL